jgi:hypothetical protein
MVIIAKREKISYDYDLTDKRLGRGADGYILEIKDKNSNEKFALKMLRACDKSRQEIRLQHISSLGCEHIVKIIDVYENYIDDLLYYLVVME